jgi:hypothetical protein
MGRERKRPRRFYPDQARKGLLMLRAIGCAVLIVVILAILILTGLLKAIF